MAFFIQFDLKHLYKLNSARKLQLPHTNGFSMSVNLSWIVERSSRTDTVPHAETKLQLKLMITGSTSLQTCLSDKIVIWTDGPKIRGGFRELSIETWCLERETVAVGSLSVQFDHYRQESTLLLLHELSTTPVIITRIPPTIYCPCFSQWNKIKFCRPGF